MWVIRNYFLFDGFVEVHHVERVNDIPIAQKKFFRAVYHAGISHNPRWYDAYLSSCQLLAWPNDRNQSYN